MLNDSLELKIFKPRSRPRARALTMLPWYRDANFLFGTGTSTTGKVLTEERCGAPK